jgi:hypothetical protein
MDHQVYADNIERLTSEQAANNHRLAELELEYNQIVERIEEIHSEIARCCFLRRSAALREQVFSLMVDRADRFYRIGEAVLRGDEIREAIEYNTRMSLAVHAVYVDDIIATRMYRRR